MGSDTERQSFHWWRFCLLVTCLHVFPETTHYINGLVCHPNSQLLVSVSLLLQYVGPIHITFCIIYVHSILWCIIDEGSLGIHYKLFVS